jgi:hypothetical protein
LAHQLVGLLGRCSREGSSVAFKGCGGGIGDGSRLVELLVFSVNIYAMAPWLCPVNRGFVEEDRRGLEHVI